jgi:hypothetical protein
MVERVLRMSTPTQPPLAAGGDAQDLDKNLGAFQRR